MKLLLSGVVQKHYLQFYSSSIAMSLYSATSICCLCIFCPFHTRGFNSCSSICCFSQQRPSCRTYFTSKDLLFFSQQLFVCFILTLRTYALYCRNKRLLISMIIIVCALAGVAAGTFGLRSSAIVPGMNCLDSYAKEITVSPGLGWVTLLVYELLVFVLTVRRICKIRAVSLAISRGHMLDIMFQDGAMYFAVMTLFNLLNILMYYCGSNTTRGSLATFTSCISVTLVSRLMLNLHKSVDAGILTTPVQDDDYDSTVLTTINVQSTVSSRHC